jgi:hypothetical protein
MRAQILGTPMNADVTPMNANGLECLWNRGAVAAHVASIGTSPPLQVSSAFIGVTSAFIGVSKTWAH